jgi:catechol 2,3-dioxygenase
LYPTRKELALALKSLVDAEYPITGTADHGVSEAIYLNDPDGNGVELYADRPRSAWNVNNDGKVEMITESLDLENLMQEL